MILRAILALTAVVGISFVSACCCCGPGPDIPTGAAPERQELPSLGAKRMASLPTNYAH